MAQIDEEWEHYDEAQQRFALNMMANEVGKCTGTSEALEKQFFETINKLLPKLNGEWKLGWGPKIFKLHPEKDNTPPLNAWFVATSDKQKTSVVAIAGTAPKSVAGWYLDFDNGHVIDWNKWLSTWKGGVTPVPNAATPNQSDPYVSRGTAHGTANILGNKSTKASSGDYVHQYLQKLPAGYNVYVTGHSMGGALSPAVALALQEKLVTGRNIVALPSAGASPGNTNFSKLWASKFPKSGSGFRANNANFYNTKDMVPMAWSTTASQDPERNIENVHKIYEGQPPRSAPGITLKLVVDGVKLQAYLAKVTYFGIPGEAFTSKEAIKIPLKTERELLDTFHIQHVDEYLKEVKVKRIVAKFKDMFREGDGIHDGLEISDEELAEISATVEQQNAEAGAEMEEGS